jgi:hypothetical protein
VPANESSSSQHGELTTSAHEPLFSSVTCDVTSYASEPTRPRPDDTERCQSRHGTMLLTRVMLFFEVRCTADCPQRPETTVTGRYLRPPRACVHSGRAHRRRRTFRPRGGSAIPRAGRHSERSDVPRRRMMPIRTSWGSSQGGVLGSLQSPEWVLHPTLESNSRTGLERGHIEGRGHRETDVRARQTTLAHAADSAISRRLTTC